MPFTNVTSYQWLYVEHVIGQLKTFKCIARQSLARVEELCAALSQRRVELYENI